MPTPHISANKGDFAQTVLFPGDPLRAKYIAENFLQDAKLVTAVRNMFGFTGQYKGKRVSVMGSGMGIPSASIYARELFVDYDVENIIRIGSAGAISEKVKIRDVVVAQGACTDSGVNRSRFGGMDFAAIASYPLLRKAVDSAEIAGKNVLVGNVMSADLFYHPDAGVFDILEKMGVLAVEMEAAGLYGVAAEYGKNALGIMTISDHIRTGEATSADERQTTFNDMVEIALEVA
ncbi:MAG: purine-nucleoside phosphorylase [Alphaproteobacteria bacterium]